VLYCGAGVPVGEGGYAKEDFIGRLDGFISKTVFFVVERAAEEFGDCGVLSGSRRNLRCAKRSGEITRTKDSRGGADEDDVARFDVRRNASCWALLKR